MQIRNLALRLAAVAFSLVLVGGYIYQRAGGALPLPWQGETEPSVDEELPQAAPVATTFPDHFYGSKSAAVFEPTESEDQAPPKLLPGSKSLILAEPESNVVPQTVPVGDDAEVTYERTALPGSKSGTVFLPSQPNPPPPRLQAVEPPQQAPPRRAVLGGTKSIGPANTYTPPPPPTPTRQPSGQRLQRQNDDVAPANNVGLDPHGLPGSKADLIFTPKDIQKTPKRAQQAAPRQQQAIQPQPGAYP